MRKMLLIAAAAALAACSTAPPNIDKEAIDDFIMAANLEPGALIRTESHDSFNHLNQHYVVYKARRAAYLIKFARRCYELDTNRITPDQRWNEIIRAGHDTLRGCRIGEIYAISDEQAEELKRLSNAPGSGNK